MTDQEKNKRREKRRVTRLAKPGKKINKFIKSNEGYKLAKELIDESDFSMERVAGCVGVTRKMLYLGLSSEKYPWIVEAVLKCLGYKVETGFNVKTEEDKDDE